MATPPTAAQIEAARVYSEAAGGQTFIVAYNGVTIAESYANGGSVNRRQLLASATKGLTGMIGAMAASDGIINLDEPVAVNALTEWQGHPLKSQITYRHLLTMSSGLEELNNLASWTDYLAAPVNYPGGSTFIYSGDPNIFGLALERRLGGESVVSYMNRRLFTPLGMSSIQWSPGSFTDGHPNLSGGAFLTARDWAKYGKFVLQMKTDEWTGPDLISQEYFDEVFKGNPSHPAYGFYWWLKEEVSPELAAIIDANNSNQFTRQIAPLINDPLIPDDFVMAAGAYEQRLYVIPSLDLFVLRNGPTTAGGQFVDTEFLDLLLTPIPEPRCDFNFDSACDIDDLNAMLAEGPIAPGVPVTPGVNVLFDLSGDGVIDNADVGQWLADAATFNGFGSPYKRGDANLDGAVDGSDFGLWNGGKFTSTLLWNGGDFNGDGVADGSDFGIWNAHKFTSSDGASAVPEPVASVLVFVGAILWRIGQRRR